MNTQCGAGVNGAWWKTFVRAIFVQVNQAKKQPTRNRIPVTIAPVRFSHASFRLSGNMISTASVDRSTTQMLS